MSWVASAIVAGSAISAGAGIYSASQNGGAPGIEDNYVQGPNYQVGQDVTKQWQNQLTQDQNDPNFGAISPDWNDMWQQTQKQVQQYYNGSSINPGVNDKINASFAQRGMSGDPAASFLQMQSGANEASDLSNLSAQQNIAKQTFANQGKNQWLQSIGNLQNQTSNAASGGTWTGAQPYATTGQQIGNAIGSFGSGLASYGLQQNSNQNQTNWLSGLLNGGGNSSNYAPGIINPGSSSNLTPTGNPFS